MSIDHRTRQILWGRAGATCSYPSCRRNLVREGTQEDREVVVGEIAHIVAQSKGGPRAELSVPGGNIDGYDNLYCSAMNIMNWWISSRIHTRWRNSSNSKRITKNGFAPAYQRSRSMKD